MKKRYFLLFFLLNFISSTYATHIVGGEIELQTVSGIANVSHRLNLNLYFDDINGQIGALDQTLTVGVFRKRDNTLMGYVVLPIIKNELITYTNPVCVQNATLRTRLIQYSSLIALNPDQFSEPEGYYIVWERCCRNNIISNIANPADAASVFYLSFPPLKVGGSTFLNSSPSFKVLTGDYICLNRPFTFDFGATDTDGDSLVYRLVTPLNGYTNRDNPRPNFPRGSSNYPLVSWANGFGISNIMGSQREPLRVNPRTGLLSVTVEKEGLYVFCVLTEEYRRGIKIGEVRRDFQLKAIDCPINKPPVAYFREKGKTEFYNSSSVVTIKLGEKKCLTILETDPDPNQVLSMKIIPVNFKSVPTVTPSTITTSSSKDTLRAEVCFDECTESLDGKPLIFDVVGSDNGCPQPLTSTLRIQVIIEPKPNISPTISTDLPNQKGEVNVGSTLKFNILGNDRDNDNITITAKGRGFNLSQVGMSFAGGSGIGKVTSPFTWTPICDPNQKGDYIVDFVVTDTRCGKNLKDSISVNLMSISPISDPPDVKTTLVKNDIEVILDDKDPASILFDVVAQDPNADPLKLYALPKGFDLKSAGMIWTDKNGVAKIINPFSWKPDCSLLKGKEQVQYEIDFVTEDNSCSPNRFDTVTVNLSLKNKVINYDVFKPANIFTPNGDNKNDYFSLDLPENNCTERFEYIEIFNRWGTSVYKSVERNFQWTGSEFASADYYYLIKFTNREFRGWVSLVR
ncbi:MAG: gliding motility-associated C-terminal domain-containing protein [Arcicella sp.]|jgi:gliding motility-associated-like protein|nr:gliding motility-associated C-terminal domain-containing protein [Arcicella sp.]